MRRNSFLALTLLSGIALICFSDSGFSADEKGKKALKQLAKKLEAKKAEDAKKTADAKKAEDAKKTTAAKKTEAGEQLEPLKPALLGGKKDTVAVAKFIDGRIDAQLAAEKVTASPVCTDEEFLRRAYLDISGVIPTAEQAKTFLASREANKRAKLIDELLASPNFGQHQADVWMSLLVQRTSDNRRVDFGSLRTWLAEQFTANKPWDAIATEIVTASGEQEKNPAVGFFLSNNTVDKMTDELCKSFLGVQLQCAQCHDHKFNDWKQTEYWAMAQFFMKVQVGGLGKEAKPNVEEKPFVRRNGKMNVLPESAKAVDPKFLQGPSPTIAQKDPARPVLAKWMTSPTNPFFARAMVNRVWGELFGRGIVNPVDDMVGQNLPSHPEMLTGLAADFAANGFDLKHLVRSICNSNAYQRSSKATAGNEKAAPHLYAKMAVKVLSPEQLFDSLSTVIKFDPKGAAVARDKSVKGFAAVPRDRFVAFFLAGAEMVSPTDYEAGIPQALKLMNSRITGGGPLAVRAVIGLARGVEALDKIYLAALSRYPTDSEKARLTSYVSQAGTVQDGLSDVLWAVLNSSEFTLNR